jgi:hypothetical protein
VARKTKTQAEVASEQYVLALDVQNQPESRNACFDAIAEIGRKLDLDVWNSTVALRDFAQYRIAQLADEKQAETQRRIDELQAHVDRS